jgi:hypothetical protein
MPTSNLKVELQPYYSNVNAANTSSMDSIGSRSLVLVDIASVEMLLAIVSGATVSITASRAMSCGALKATRRGVAKRLTVPRWATRDVESSGTPPIGFRVASRTVSGVAVDANSMPVLAAPMEAAAPGDGE